MTISEAMFEGCRMSDPLEGMFYHKFKPWLGKAVTRTCALGALYLGLGLDIGAVQKEDGINGPKLVSTLGGRYPVLYQFMRNRSKCNGCRYSTVWEFVAHLNDYHHVPRLKLGRWLERMEKKSRGGAAIARKAHNLEAAGLTPAPATINA